jgi:glycine cleavage system transcriptional repressor
MILIIRLPRRLKFQELECGFDTVKKSLGLSLLMKPLSAKEARRDQTPAGHPFILSVYGSDHPGIVYRVTRLLASYAINVTDVNTRVIGPMKSPIYVMVLEVALPKKVKIEGLRAALQKLQKTLNVDIALHPVESAQL